MDPNNTEDVQFETDSYKAVKLYNEPDAPKIVRLVMKYSSGAIKEEKQAYWVLLGFVILAFIAAIFVLHYSFSSNRNPKLTPEQQNDLLRIMPQDIPPTFR